MRVVSACCYGGLLLRVVMLRGFLDHNHVIHIMMIILSQMVFLMITIIKTYISHALYIRSTLLWYLTHIRSDDLSRLLAFLAC